jgi:hypothetical protein
MGLRRVSTINGNAYALSGQCEECGEPIWTEMDAGDNADVRQSCECGKPAPAVTPTSRPTPAPAINRDHSLDNDEDTVSDGDD